jgi:hypothetical protein
MLSSGDLWEFMCWPSEVRTPKADSTMTMSHTARDATSELRPNLVGPPSHCNSHVGETQRPGGL